MLLSILLIACLAWSFFFLRRRGLNVDSSMSPDWPADYSDSVLQKPCEDPEKVAGLIDTLQSFVID